MLLQRSLLASLLIGAALFSTASVAAQDEAAPSGCAAKRQALAEQIEAAKQHGNSAQQAGLEKALSEVTAHCDDASLHKSREEKVLDAQHEVAQREADLRKAMAKGDQAKIDTRKTKLAEAHKELQEAQEQLEH
ncbi:DUF1090 domain-containing protein [Pseudomonas sp. LS44]|uniref:DUF1090 domain-containing protein n=1 Tax=Pseudomonas sp. LS44 TaxID=1357074 RepID=UPI00215ADB37|nr:DUF1090 domain-containing protein [Pseudomonas sp. LS44]UVE18143.1 DUF1090 domain-containing protein [Pseudomonas sp. LS44]